MRENVQIPLRDYAVFKTDSLNEARSRVAEILCDHSIRIERRKQSLKARCHVAPMASASLCYIDYGTRVRIDAERSSNCYIAQMSLGGDALVTTANESYRSQPGNVMVPSPNRRVQWQLDTDSLIIRFDKIRLERHLTSLLDSMLTRPLIFDNSMNMRAEPRKCWSRTIQYLLNEFEAHGEICNRLTQVNLEQLAMNALLFTQRHNYSDQLLADTPEPAPWHVRAAEEYIAGNCAEPITVEDLAREAHVSIRTLHKAFQRHRGISPMKFLKATRMERVHDELKNASPSDTITRIASDWGFGQLGRFSVEYRSRFGESPSDTLRH